MSEERTNGDNGSEIPEPPIDHDKGDALHLTPGWFDEAKEKTRPISVQKEYEMQVEDVGQAAFLVVVPTTPDGARMPLVDDITENVAHFYRADGFDKAREAIRERGDVPFEGGIVLYPPSDEAVDQMAGFVQEIRSGDAGNKQEGVGSAQIDTPILIYCGVPTDRRRIEKALGDLPAETKWGVTVTEDAQVAAKKIAETMQFTAQNASEAPTIQTGVPFSEQDTEPVDTVDPSEADTEPLDKNE